MLVSNRAVLPCVALVALVLAAPAAGADYYVDASQGDDRADCYTSPGPGSAACRSIGYVTSNVDLDGGDTVHIASGTYREHASLSSSDSGSSDSSRVTFIGEGASKPLILALSATPLDDASFVACTAARNCNGEGRAFDNVYRLDLSGHPADGRLTGAEWELWETVWNDTKIFVDDTGATDAQFYFDTPVPLTAVHESGDNGGSFLSLVEALPGSWWHSGSFLYVHTFDSVAPSVSGTDIEIALNRYGFTLNGADYLTFDNLEFRYNDRAINSLAGESDYITIRNIDAYSGVSSAFGPSRSGYDHWVMQNIRIKNRIARTPPSFASGATCSAGTPKTKNDCWVDKNSGQCWGGNGEYHLFSHIDARNCWNVVQTAANFSTYEFLLMLNSPNHNFNMEGANNVIRHTISLNGQEDFFAPDNKGNRWYRNVGKLDLLVGNNDDTVHNSCLTSDNGGQNARNLSVKQPAPNFKSDYNWFEPYDPGHSGECRTSGTAYGCLTTNWQNNCDGTNICDRNSITGDPMLAGFTAWPPTNGLELSRKHYEDFYPTEGSVLIDAGDPDIDGDGVLERSDCDGVAPDDDDCCNEANHCYGSAPDIGPFEYGLDIPSDQTCGNGSREGTEQCDGSDLGGQTCQTRGYDSGTLRCSSSCTFDESECATGGGGPVCGNGILETGELCDGSDLGGNTCTSIGQGYTGGTLGCNGTCDGWDESGCTTGGGGSADNDCTDGYCRIDCTDDAYVQALNDICTAGGGTINFNCRDTVIAIDTGTYSNGDRDIPVGCDNVVIDGEDRNITLQPASLWRDQNVCGNGSESCDADADDVPDACPNTESLPRFMMIRSDNNSIRNLKIAWWGDGINFDGGSSTSASGNVVSGVTCEYPGDDCFVNEGIGIASVGAFDNTIESSVINNACDKAMQHYGRASWSDGKYDLKIIDVTCNNCKQPLRMTDTGRVLVRNFVVRASSPPHPQFSCDRGIRADGTSDTIITVEGGSFSDCKGAGIYVSTDPQVIVRGGTVFRDNTVGLQVSENSRGSVEDATFEGNGRGIWLSSSSGSLDAGGGSVTFTYEGSVSSAGRNTFLGSSSWDVDNDRTGYTLMAEGNCWNGGDPAATVSGEVDYEPRQTDCSGGGGNDPPATPSNLRRTDTR